MQAEGPDVESILTIWDDVSDREVLKGSDHSGIGPLSWVPMCELVSNRSARKALAAGHVTRFWCTAGRQESTSQALSKS